MQSLLLALSVEAASNENSDIRRGLQYGDTTGSSSFRQQLQLFLERQTSSDDFGSFASRKELRSRDEEDNAQGPTSLLITNGVSHGIELLCAALTNPGDVILVERPTYFLVCDIFRCHGLSIRPLPVDSCHGGVDVQRLVELVEGGSMRPPRMIYIIPSYQNPTGRTMPIDDRIELAIFAHKYNVLVVSDEVYHLLDWRSPDDGPRPGRMALIGSMVGESPSCEEGKPLGGCVSVSSFTKIFAPGLRCGWIEGHASIVEALEKYGYLQSQGGCAPFVGEIMKGALGLRVADQVLAGLTNSYKDRVKILLGRLEEEPRIQVVNRPLGGYFLWVKFPDNVSSEKLLDYCRDKVKFMPGLRCDPFEKESFGELKESGEPFSTCARLCFADLDPDDLELGIDRLISCFQQYLIEAE